MDIELPAKNASKAGTRPRRYAQPGQHGPELLDRALHEGDALMHGVRGAGDTQQRHAGAHRCTRVELRRKGKELIRRGEVSDPLGPPPTA